MPPSRSSRRWKAGSATRCAPRRTTSRASSRARRLDRSRALPQPLDELAYAPPEPAALNALLDRLGFAELLVAETAARSTSRSARPSTRITGEHALHALIEDDGTLAGIAIATEHDARYVPFGAAGWPLLAAWLADPSAPKLGHDLVGTIVALRHVGVELAGIVGDSACASHLTQPSNWAPHDLRSSPSTCSAARCPTLDAVRGVGPKRKPWAALPVERAAEFAAICAGASLGIWRALAPHVEPALLASTSSCRGRSCAWS